MAELAVAYGVETAMGDACLHSRHQVDPEGDFRPVEWCLLDDALGAVGHVGHDHLVLLVGRVAQKVALEHGASSAQLAADQAVVGAQDGFELLGEGHLWCGDVYHGVVLAHLGAVVEAEHLCTGVLERHGL